MTIQSLTQPPFSTSLMGVVWEAARYYGFDYSRGMLFGATGHAFLINVHEELCPSSPYAWDRRPFMQLAGNLGLVIRTFGESTRETLSADRDELERQVRARIDDGVVCAILNLDHQLILGYDDDGLTLAEPWGENADTTPARLTFGTWAEFGHEPQAEIYEIRRGSPATLGHAVPQSLRFAVDLWEDPGRYAHPSYGIGPDAYDNWMNGIAAGCGTGHGAWWIGAVWSECRDAAKEYLREIARHFPETAELAHELSGRYGRLAETLHAAADRSLAAQRKIELLKEARILEAASIPELAAIAAILDGEQG